MAHASTGPAGTRSNPVAPRRRIVNAVKRRRLHYVDAMGTSHELPPAYAAMDGMERSDAQFWRERDIEENRDSTPPEGEAIGRPVIKVAECFVGGDVQALVDGCRALGIAPADNLMRRSDVYT